MAEKKSAGRPRKEGATRELMDIARRLVHQEGYEQVTMNMIADAAGVGRQTVYRRWASKADLVMDALLDHARTFKFDAGAEIADALSGYLRELFRGLEIDGVAVRSLIAAAQKDDEFGKHFQEKFVSPRDTAVKEILELGIRGGQLPQDADVDLASELIHGAFWYRLLLNRPLDGIFADQLAKTVIIALAGK